MSQSILVKLLTILVTELFRNLPDRSQVSVGINMKIQQVEVQMTRHRVSVLLLNIAGLRCVLCNLLLCI